MTSETSNRCWYVRGFARLGFWIPVAVLLITRLVMPFAVKVRELGFIVGGLLYLALIIGFCLTALSLLMMRKCGKKGILGYGVVALLLYAFFAVSTVVLLMKVGPGVAKERERSKAVVALVEEVHAECPKMLNEVLRFDSVSAISSTHVQFKYSHIALRADQVTQVIWEEISLVPEREVQNLSAIRDEFLQLGVTVTEDYLGVYGERVLRTKTTPEDYRKSMEGEW